MSTLVGFFKAVAAIPQLLKLILEVLGAWRKANSFSREKVKNNRNDAAVDALVGVYNENGQHSGAIKGSGSERDGGPTPTGS